MDPYARERRFLRGVRAGARRGRGAAVVVRGDPGAGQDELLRSVSRPLRDVQVHQLHGFRRERHLALGALPDLLRPLRVWLGVLPCRHREAVEAALAGEADAPDGLLGPACVGLLAEAAGHRSQLVCVHDAHWLDPASLDVLGHVARHAPPYALAVIIGVDAGGDGPDTTGVQVLPLRRLSLDESVDLLTAERPDIAPSVARGLGTATGGNLGALRQLVGALTPAVIQGREPLPDPLPVGGQLAQTLGARLAALPEDTRRALLVSVLEPEGRLATVAAALQALGGALDHLQPAESAGLLRIDTAGRLALTHPLLASVAASVATSAERRAAHQALADASPPRDRGRHLVLAAAGPDPEMARRLTRVAQDAASRWQFTQAASAHARVARLVVGDSHRHDHLCAAAQAALLAGDACGALISLDAAGGPVRASARARADLLRSAALTAHGRLRAAHLLLEQDSAATVPAREAAAGAAEAVALLRLLRGDLPTARTLLGDTPGAGRATCGAGGVQALVRVLAGQRPADAEPLGDPEATEGVGAPLHRLAEGYALILAERHDEAYRVLKRVAGRCREDEAAGVLVVCDLGLAALDTRTGQWRSAARRATEAIRLTSHPPQPVLLAWAYGLLARVEADRGDGEDALHHAHRALEWAQEADARLLVPPALHALGIRALSLGHSEQAIPLLQEAGRLLASAGVGDPRVVPWAPDLVEAAVHTGVDEPGRTALATLEDQARTTGSLWARGVALRCRALLDGTHAETWFGKALDVQMTLDSPYEVARTELAFGQRLRRERRRGPAQLLLRRAHARFVGLGGRAWAELTAAELRAVGHGVGKPDGVRGLTPQEQRVAQLVADGASNQQVAAQLFLSRKTVENHLTRTYAKLGISSRTQLAKTLRRPSAHGA